MREQLPSLARTDAIQGGVALAAAFIEQHPLLFMEGGSELFAYLSMEECQFCAHEQERAQQAVNERGYQVGGEFVVYKNDAKFRFDLEQLDEPLLIVQFEVYEPPYTFVNAAGEITDQGGDKYFEVGLALLFRDGLWRVREFGTRTIELTAWEDVPPEVGDILERG